MPKKKSVPVRSRKTGPPATRSRGGPPPLTVRVLIVGQDALLRRAVREALRQPAPGGKGKRVGHEPGAGSFGRAIRVTEAPATAEAVSLLHATSRPAERLSVAVLVVRPATRRPALKLARQLGEAAPELPLILCIPPEDAAWWEGVAQRLHPWRVSVVTQPPDPLSLRGLIRALLGRGVSAAVSPHLQPPRPLPASPSPPTTALAPGQTLLRHLVEGLLQGLGQWGVHLERPSTEPEAAPGGIDAWSRCRRRGTLHRAAALVSQLTLLESPTSETERAACDLVVVTGQVVGHLQQLLRGGVEVECHGETGPLLVPADATALQRVLTDLALLALPVFSPGSRLRFNLDRRPAASGSRTGPSAGEVLVQIEGLPTGEPPVGPAPDAGPSPFLTGLEWTTAQAMITRWKGRLERSRRPNGHMLMELHLPLLAEAEVSAPDTLASAPTLPTSAPAEVPAGAVVLLVDDDENVRATTRLFLEEYDCRILEATDSTRALRLWKEQGRNIRLLVVDLVIPGEVDGLQLARRLQGEQPGLRVLLTTGYAGAGLIEELKAMPETDFLPKPYTYVQMHAVLRRHLRPRLIQA